MSFPHPPRHPHPFPARHTFHPRTLSEKRRFVFMRFAFVFGGLGFIFLIALALVFLLLGKPLDLVTHLAALELMSVCAVVLIFVVLITALGGWAFRRYGSPVAEVMSAADSVAGGDLGVRVRELLPGEMGQLARSFNRMTASLQRLDQQRRSMTADIAHELRTPLHILQGNLEGILDGVYEPTPENLQAALEETRLLARLVEDLQTLSLAEAGQLPLHPVRFSAANLVSDVAASFSARAEGTGVEISVQIECDPDSLMLHADPDRLDQVLSNLVANALRHTSPGGHIILSAVPLSGGIRLTVADDGEGISAEDLPHVFDRFWRADRSRSRASGGGSGLGLAIARQLVQAHGGDIRVESQPGQGANFVIELPGNHT